MVHDLDIAFATELTTVGRKARNLFESYVRERNLTLARARALLMSSGRTMNQTELAAALEIEPASVVRLLDELERQNWIVRAPVKGDRRANHIELTDAAIDQVRELGELGSVVRTMLLRDIEPDRLEIALEVLRQVSSNAEAALNLKPRVNSNVSAR